MGFFLAVVIMVWAIYKAYNAASRQTDWSGLLFYLTIGVYLAVSVFSLFE